MRRLSWLILTALLLVGPEQSRAFGNLQVIETTPQRGETLGLESEVSFTFDRPINCPRATVTVTPELPGTVDCRDDDATLYFIPTQPFNRDSSYSFVLSATARDGARMVEPFTLMLSTLGYLEVVEVLPENASANVETSAAITVIFNRPVVPLLTSPEMDSLPEPLAIEPAIEGQGEWLNTSIYLFHPDAHLDPGTEYTITVAEGLEASDGAILDEPYHWTFSTVEPQVLRVDPRDDSRGILLDPELTVYFNQPMAHDDAEDSFFVRPARQSRGSVAGTFEWFEANTGFTFKPDDLLQFNTTYRAGFASGSLVRSEHPLTGQTNWTFTTVPLPAITGTYPADGDTNVTGYGGFQIFFASPMDADSFEGKITVEPEPEIEQEYYQYMSYAVVFPALSSTTYTVTVAPGPADLYGNVIDEGITVTYTTAQAPPVVSLNIPGFMGFYNAYNDETGIYVTHRNIDHLGLTLYNIPTDEFVQALIGDVWQYEPPPNHLLRQWTMEVDNPLNQYVPRFLSLGDSCEGAPQTHLRVGLEAVVAEGDPASALYDPSNNNARAFLYPGTRLPIVAGPSCADGVRWWEVELGANITGWVAENEGDAYRLEPETPPETTHVPLGDAGSNALSPGIYFLRVDTPDFPIDNQIERTHFMMVMTANLTVKASLDHVLVWASDVNTGEPIPNTPITVYDGERGVVAAGVTDGEGVMSVETPRVSYNLMRSTRVAVLQTDTHFGIGTTSWADGIDPGMFGQLAAFWPDDYRVYVYTDRPIYRPDQTVYFRAVIRANDDLAYTPPDMRSLPVQITDSSGEVIFSHELELTPYGTLNGEVDLADDAPLGYYRVTVTIPSANNQSAMGGSTGFSVAEYRLPEFQVNVTPENDQVTQGDTMRLAVNNAYYFGGPVKNAAVSYDVIAQPYTFRYTGRGRYSFYDYYAYDERDYFSSREVADGTGTTDAQGQLLLELPAELGNYPFSQTFTLEATTSDETGLTVSGRAQVIVHSGTLYLGTRPERYVNIAGEEAAIHLIAVDWDSQGIPNQDIEMEVVERRWHNVQEVDESGHSTWTWEVEEIPVTTGEVTTDADGETDFMFTPPNGGTFEVKLSTRDSAGNRVNHLATIWASGPEYVSWRQENNNRIELIADQESYHVGDTAEILIASPFQGTTRALISVERGGVLHYETVTMRNNSHVYRLPLTPDYAPNVFVTVMLVKGVDENNPVAAFRMGLAQLMVDTEQREITLDISADSASAQPGDTVRYTVHAADYQGDPVDAEIGVGLTDLASLSLADPNSPTLLNFFYSLQGLGVRTTTPLTMNTDQLTQNALDRIKGGGGGGVGLGVIEVREDFIDTPYWNATLVTGSDGETSFNVTLPDNLTTWRLDARAVTKGDDGNTLVGQATFDLLSTRPLIIRPVTPRFFVVDDQTTLAAVVNNNTGQALDVNVALQADGVVVDGDTSQTVTIPAESVARVEWAVTAEDTHNVELVFSASSVDGEYTDASRPPLGLGDQRLIPVYRYEVPETVGTAGMLREAETRTEAVTLPPNMDITRGELTVRLEPSLAATTVDGLRYLQNYPHQCIEQTVSRFLPNIMTYRAMEQLGVADEELRAQLNDAVIYALQRLYAEQKSDGGWGWFVQEESNPLTTAYALIGLVEAERQGFLVEAGVISRAQDYLRTTFIAPGLDKPNWQLNRQAFVLYALARSGRPDVARTANLYAYRERLSTDARAFLAMALNLIDPASTRVATLLSDVMNDAIPSATGTHWEDSYYDYWNWSTDARSTAIALDALVQLRPDSELIPNVVRWLIVQRGASVWGTTQEAAWSIMGLTDWMVLTGELHPDYRYDAIINGNTLTDGEATPANVRDTLELTVQVGDLLSDELNRLVIERGSGEGVLYYTAHLRAYLPVPQVEPLDRGIMISRQYFRPDDDVPVTEASVGEVIQAYLTVIAPHDLYYVVIEDALPAGTEAINPHLNTSQQIGTRPSINRIDPLRRGWGWWWFSRAEYQDEKVVLYTSYLPAGSYEYIYSLRPTIPGTYNVIPPTGQEFYFPEVYGRGAGSLFTVLPGDSSEQTQ